MGMKDMFRVPIHSSLFSGLGFFLTRTQDSGISVYHSDSQKVQWLSSFRI